MHLSALAMYGPMHSIVGEWQLPDYFSGYDYPDPQFWIEAARVLERGKFDMVFFADVLSAWSVPPDNIVRYSVNWPVHDAVPLLGMIAAATERIGVATTSTTSYTHPYFTARTFASLAHITRGRVGWNVVTSSNVGDLANLGLERLEAHDERYDRGDEFIEVCQKLWKSWDPDAIVLDRATGSWADPAKVHAIDHEGRFFKCRGPLSVAPAPTGGPVLSAAGQSDRGLDFVAKHADVSYGVQWTGEAMRAHRDRLREKAVKFGRSADAVKILWGVKTFVGATEEEAKAKQRAAIEAVPIRGALEFMKGFGFDYDSASVDLDTPIDATEKGRFSEGLRKSITETLGHDATLRDAAVFIASGNAPHIAGTPDQVAARLEELFEAAGGDGFLINIDYSLDSIRAFVEGVVPALQARGVYRTDYAGTTLREHVQQDA